jgi:protein involved in polysaccharide export with SLBB domain
MVGEIAKAAGGLTPEQRQDVLLIIERHQTKALEALSNARLR